MKNYKQKVEKSSSKTVIVFIILITILMGIVIGLSFMLFKVVQSSNKDSIVKTGTVSMTYTENTNEFSIENALATSDEMGKVASKKNEYFDFSVSSEIVGKTTIAYEISAIKLASSTISDNNIHLYLEVEKNGTYIEVLKPSIFIPIRKKTEIGSPIGSMVLLKRSVSNKGVAKYRFRMWLAESATTMNEVQNCTVKINVYGKAK